jgi:hypothetical protein
VHRLVQLAVQQPGQAVLVQVQHAVGLRDRVDRREHGLLLRPRPVAQHRERQLGQRQPQHRVQGPRRLGLLRRRGGERGTEAARDDSVLGRACPRLVGHEQAEHQRYHRFRVSRAGEELLREVLQDRAGPLVRG